MKMGEEMVINSDKDYAAKYATGKERVKEEDKNVGKQKEDRQGTECRRERQVKKCTQEESTVRYGT